MKNFFRKLHIGEGSRKGIRNYAVSEQRQQPSVVSSSLESVPTRSPAPAPAEADGSVSTSPRGEEIRQSGVADRRWMEEEEMETRQSQEDEVERERRRSREEEYAVEEGVITDDSVATRARKVELDLEKLRRKFLQFKPMMEMSLEDNREEIQIQIAEQMSLDSCWASSSTSEKEITLHSVPLRHLKDITNNFSEERLLGRGGFGSVYKGVLRNGKVIAVKKFVQSISSSHEQFENEVNLLRKLEHTNIVQLVGFCYETQPLQKLHEGKYVFAWETECLLCLEYLPKGSLDKYISGATSGLDWPTRFKIIEGVSYGLQYLHEQSDCCIVHLDLKPGNILLDENMVPKITDFGLSRLFDRKTTIHTAITRGTLGYMPPEYLRGIITPMSDIYSLGVIILEVITGHRDYPYDIKTHSTVFIDTELQRWRNVLQEEPGDALLETDCQQIKRCIQIGLICVNTERTKRPTMKKIIDMLHELESMESYIRNELSSHDNQAEL